jgi:hypothetical protein
LSRYFIGQKVPPWPVVMGLCRLVQRDPRPLRRLWEAASRLPASAGKTSRATKAAAARNDLPFDVGDFTGRQQELAAVFALVAAHRAVTIDGMAGVGKTCLAVHAAHLMASDYPDGQLYLDLHGFTPGREPLDSGAALRLLLSALDVPPGKIPEGTEERAARLRAELSTRRAIVVLDNVASAEQARLLLPGAGSTAVLITSRNRLLELDGVPPVSLAVLEARMPRSCSCAPRVPASVATVAACASRTLWPRCCGCAGICRWPSGSPRPG